MTQAGREPRAAPAEGPSIARAAAAELIGSFTVVLVGAGSVVVAGTAGSGLVGVALASGLAFAVALTVAMPLSGGGVNPVLTTGLWVAGRISARRAVAYVAAELVGAVAAGAVLRLATPEATWRPAGLGAPLPAQGIGAGRAVMIEAVLSFLLTVVFFATTADGRDGDSAQGAAAALGALLAAAILVAWPLTGAALNPARAMGPEVAGGTWGYWWVYWIGPGAGGVTGSAVYWSAFVRGALPSGGPRVGRRPRP